MHSRSRSAAALLGLLVVAAACAAPPQPASPPSAPAPASLPACDVTAGTSLQRSSSAADGAASEGQADLVLVAVDDEGRPAFVPTDVDSAAEDVRSLASEPGVEVVGLDVDRAVSVATASTTSATTAAAAGSGDPRRAEQWALDQLGIDALRSRSRGQGVDVAVVDTGVASGHVDLGATTCSGVAFLENSGVAQHGKGAQDPHGHGTHVAGIVAATTDNGHGTAGVAPSARIIPVRVLSSNGSGWSSDVARGITWAVDHGAEVINLSLGGGHSWSVQVAVEYAEANGVVVVAAAGNDGLPHGAEPAPSYPGALDEALAVASIDRSGGVSSFSSRGGYVDVAAPGGSILSTVRSGGWGTMSGTSMATPHVAGVVAMVVAVEPALSPAQVRARITTTADEAGPVGHDHAYGWGRLDPSGALDG